VSELAPRPPKRYVDEFRRQIQAIRDGYLEADEIDWDEAISMVSELRRTADWIWDGLEHGAIVSVLETAQERALTELNYYRDKQALEELDPDQILRKLEDEELEG